MSKQRTWILYRHKNQNMKLISGREYQVTFWVESELRNTAGTVAYRPVEHYAEYYDHVHGEEWVGPLVRLRAPRNSAFPDHVFPIGQAPEAGRWPLARFMELYEPHPTSGRTGTEITKAVESVRG